MVHTMGKAIGIGGVFLHFEGPKKALFEWYERYLGLEFSDYGTGFISGRQLMVLSFKRSDKTNNPYLNIRVDHIDEVLTNIQEDHRVKILSHIEHYDYGQFASFLDPFGNAIELWEANEEAYIKMVQQEHIDYKKNKIVKHDIATQKIKVRY